MKLESQLNQQSQLLQIAGYMISGYSLLNATQNLDINTIFNINMKIDTSRISEKNVKKFFFLNVDFEHCIVTCRLTNSDNYKENLKVMIKAVKKKLKIEEKKVLNCLYKIFLIKKYFIILY